MPKKAGATSKASGKPRVVERVGHGATLAGNRRSAWRAEDLPSGPG
ncbi:RIKEN cDNA 3110040N11, isoform CRA_b [Mus musculus]|uniref:RIKEN cDNA 3110040N11 gene n=1 Tax=Mus musculus TaxID=10090 RepID=D6RIL2_MOUSE|nr:RIKEN cDNA 3110040N11, isoform CRA_b [Mus musculus]